MKSILVFLIVGVFFGVSSATVPLNRRVMPWMCLERCGHSKDVIQQQIATLASHTENVDSVSYELFNLGENVTLETVSGLSDVTATLKQAGFKTYAMISSYPYPKEFIDWMRQVFANPNAFIVQCIRAWKRYGFTGYNIDWEPTTGFTVEDSVAYANFLTTFANQMHKYGIEVTVDVGTENILWNYALLGKTSVDKIFTMSTYTGNWNLWQERFQHAVSTIPLEKLAIGIENVDPNTKKALTDEQLEQRFKLIEDANVQMIGIWEVDIPNNYWSFISHWQASEETANN